MSSQIDVKHFLEKSAQAYHNEIVRGWEELYHRKRQRLYEALRRFHLPGHALELGSADGIMTEKLLPDFESVTVVDGSILFLEQIRGRLKSNDLFLVHSLFEQFEPVRKFSTVFMTHILEHLDDPVRLLSRAKTWLETGGRIAIAVPNANSLHRLVGVKMGMLAAPHALNQQDVILGHKRVYYPSELRDHVTQAGLRVVHFGGLMIKPISNRQIEQQWSDELVEAFFALSDDLPELCSEIYVIAEA